MPLLGLLLGVGERVEHRVGVRVFSLNSNSSSRSSSNSSTSSTSSSRRSRSNSTSTDRATLGKRWGHLRTYENRAESNEIIQFSIVSTTLCAACN